MTQYTIEFRFRDDAQSYVKQLMYHLEAKFHIGLFKEEHPLPHVTLAGPLIIESDRHDDEKKLITEFIALCAKTPLASYEINSYAFSDPTRTVCIRIDPSDKMMQFEIGLLQALAPYVPPEKEESTEPYVFHATVARHVDLHKYDAIKTHGLQLKPLHFKHHITRVALTRDHKLVCEYDFLTHSVLTQKEALDKQQEFTDRSLYHQFINKKFNPDGRLNEVPIIPPEVLARPVWSKISDSLKKI